MEILKCECNNNPDSLNVTSTGRLSHVRSFLLLRSSPAPLSLCSFAGFDLKDDSRLCPVERRALKDFYHSAKGAEWTDAENWLSEYELTCNWKGITCNENLTIIGLNLTHNSLSGKLSSSISELRSLEILDLSDNDIQVSEANVNSFLWQFSLQP